MATIRETLEMCKIVIDGLAVGAHIPVQRSSMIELSNHIAIALEDERNERLEGIYSLEWVDADTVRLTKHPTQSVM